MVAAGDGSVGWVMDNMRALPNPLAILPLGTGNDLANVLKWGNSFPNQKRLDRILWEVKSADEDKLDRWKVVLEGTESQSGDDFYTSKMMNNYISFGPDARTAYKFHQVKIVYWSAAKPFKQ